MTVICHPFMSVFCHLGVFASLTLCTHVKYARDQWRTHTEYLKPMMFTGCFGQLAGVCGFVAYITLASVLSQGTAITIIRFPHHLDVQHLICQIMVYPCQSKHIYGTSWGFIKAFFKIVCVPKTCFSTFYLPF